VLVGVAIIMLDLIMGIKIILFYYGPYKLPIRPLTLDKKF